MIRERIARAVFSLGCLIAIAAIVNCHPAPHPVTPDAMGDAAPATCLDVCRHGQALSCAFAQDTPAGVSCAQVCANNQSVGIATWDLDCRARAASCAAIDACR